MLKYNIVCCLRDNIIPSIVIDIFSTMILSYSYYLQLTLGAVNGVIGHDRMVVGFTTTCAIKSYHH